MKAWTLDGLRYFFCLLLVTTAVGKLLDNRGFADVIATYEFGLGPGVRLCLGLMVSLIELFLGLSLLRMQRMQLKAICVFLVHFGYTVLALSSISRGLHLSNCGCFGIFFARPLTWSTLVEDSVLTLMSFAFLWAASKRGPTNFSKLFTS